MVTFIIVVGVVALVAYRLKEQLQKGYNYAGRKAAPVRSRMLPVPQRFKDILLKYFSYYQNLSPQNQIRFERKVANFVYSKRFIPRNVDEVTIEAKVLIAASAVQLTFGLPDIYLQHFSKILVYPNDYYSRITRRFHKGEVNPMFGVIVLSWQSFVDGYITPEDSVNLGLHEMAHALRLENIIRNDEYQFFEEKLIQQLDHYAYTFCNSITSWDDTFLRPYACTNEHEFFSVAVENFFERSREFKKKLPDLYHILSRLLNQDPIALLYKTNSLS